MIDVLATLARYAEHLWAFLTLIALVIGAWGWVKLRQYRMSVAQQDATKRHYANRRPHWSEPTDSEGDTHVH